jgi:hypothetical protein
LKKISNWQTPFFELHAEGSGLGNIEVSTVVAFFKKPFITFPTSQRYCVPGIK